MRPTALIVDDSLTVRADLQELLEGAGFETVTAASCAEARAALATPGFSILLLDVMLPDGDGVDLLAEVRRTPRMANLPVILLSTEADVADRVRGLTTGADEYVGKPYDRARVAERARALARRYVLDRAAIDDRSVLLIDDSPTFRHALSGALEAAGYSVLTAMDGEEGLKTAAQSRPRAIIVDGIMPGIDGTTVVRRLRMDPTLRSTPCLMLTGSEAASSELQALDAGADAYVRKAEDMTVILARFAAVVRRTEAGPQMFGSSLGPKRILAVDDSPTYLGSLTEELTREGHAVVPASSGTQALELLATQPVDCILLDLMMPGLSGQDTCRRIKHSPAWRDIPLMILTALEERDAMVASIDAGADDYVAKSSSFEVLRARLNAQLRRRQFEEENRHIRDELLQRELEANETRAARELARARAELLADLSDKNDELEQANRDLEAFSYSVSHDLRAPLRSIDGFSAALVEDHAAALDPEAKQYLGHIREAAQRMGQLIDDLLRLARLGRSEFDRRNVDLSAAARAVAERLRAGAPHRSVRFHIPDGILAECDGNLLGVALDNLFGNAWKFTSQRVEAVIELGREQSNGEIIYFVRDNGAGFDMAFAGKLFGAFQRLHSTSEFEGTGIGLTTVARVIQRHGGRVWAEGAVGSGATFYFTLRAASS